MEGSLLSVRAEERYTEPEKTMTESDLLGLMEKYGIGTDASMATHIKNICGRISSNIFIKINIFLNR
jgi:DNA topoisomerase-3